MSDIVNEHENESKKQEETPSLTQTSTSTSTNLTSTVTYYKTLTPETIHDEVEMMKIANVKELYELIESDCRHYVSIIENYRDENLQTLFNMIVRRIEGHLMIKFKLNANDRWVEVGFFDDSNTDEETLSALKDIIKYYLNDYGKTNTNRRQHLASQLDQDTIVQQMGDQLMDNNESKCEQKPVLKNVIPDDHFEPSKNQDLKISEQQSRSAGYLKPTRNAKETMKKIHLPVTEVFDISKFMNKQEICPESNVETVCSQFNTDHTKKDFGCNKLLTRISDMNEHHHDLLGLLWDATNELQTHSMRTHGYVYDILSKVISEEEPSVIVSVMLDLVSKLKSTSTN
jgi:hypothetical protein